MKLQLKPDQKDRVIRCAGDSSSVAKVGKTEGWFTGVQGLAPADAPAEPPFSTNGFRVSGKSLLIQSISKRMHDITNTKIKTKTCLHQVCNIPTATCLG